MPAFTVRQHFRIVVVSTQRQQGTSPFRYELAHMLDPKCIGTLVGFGGIDGLLRRLGINPDTGLVTNTQHVHSSESSHKLNPADKHVFFCHYRR